MPYIFEDDKAAIAAGDKWATMAGVLKDRNHMYAFAAWLGDPFHPDSGRDKIVDMDKPEIRRKVELINGPNGHTILKMFEAQNES